MGDDGVELGGEVRRAEEHPSGRGTESRGLRSRHKVALGSFAIAGAVGVAALWAVSGATPQGEPSADAGPANSSPSPSNSGPDEQTSHLRIVKGKGSLPLPQGLQRVAREVSELRGLELPSKLTVSVLGPKDWAKRFDENASVGAMRQEQELLDSLGLVPEGVDLVEIQEEIKPSSTIGFYLPKSKTLLLREDPSLPPAIRETVIAHELVHALQDHAFDLRSGIKDIAQVEHASALQALVEGDATRIELMWSRRFQSAKERAVVQNWERRSKQAAGLAATTAATSALDFYSFPYIYGRRFVSRIAKRGGDEAVNAAFANPPLTTEAVLHPAVYFEGEGSTSPDLTPPDSDWIESIRWELGELELRGFFAALGPGLATDVAAGWNGAIIQLYKRGDETATALRLSFDDRREAVEACRAMPTWYSAISGGVVVSDQVMQSSPNWMARSCPNLQVDVAIAFDRETVTDMVGGVSKGNVP